MKLFNHGQMRTQSAEYLYLSTSIQVVVTGGH